MDENEEFRNVQLEKDTLREICYWSQFGGHDIIAENSLAEEHDLFTDERSMAWDGLVDSYSKTSSVNFGAIRLSVPESLRGEILDWMLGQSEYGSPQFVDWENKLTELKRLRACRQIVRATGHLMSLRGKGAQPKSVAYQMVVDLEKVVLDGDVADNAGEEFDRYAEVMKKGGTWVSGLNQLDHQGRFGGYYTIIGARSHHGKTAVMVSMLLNQLLLGHSVFMWQGEQTRAQMYMRFICQLTGLRSFEVLSPNDKEQRHLIKGARKIIDVWLSRDGGKQALYLYDGRRTVYDVMRLVRGARQKHKVCVAYLDQLSKFARDNSKSREQAYSDISEFLAVESLKMQQPIILAHQLNIKERKDVSGPPAFWQVKDCGRLYEDCDVWITVDRPEVDAERMIEFDKAKSKWEAKGDLNEADKFDVKGRVKIKVEKDRVATYGAREEWLGFDHKCGKIFSRIYGPDAIQTALHPEQQSLDDVMEARDGKQEEF